MLGKIDALAAQRHTFAFESTLSGRGYLALFKRIKAAGYKIHVIFLWLPRVELAIQRVQDRVRRGGHSVPEQDIRRRFGRGMRNLLTEYHALVDSWTLFDNSESQPQLIAKTDTGEIIMIDVPLFLKIKGELE